MAAPGMVGIPFLMNYLEKKGTLARYPRIAAPLQASTYKIVQFFIFLGLLIKAKNEPLKLQLQMAVCGVILTFATPMCCAIFEQRASIDVSSCEDHIQKAVSALPEPRPSKLYYNKGL